MKVATLDNAMGRLIPSNVSQSQPLSHNDLYGVKYSYSTGLKRKEITKNIAKNTRSSKSENAMLKKKLATPVASSKIVSNNINKIAAKYQSETPEWFFDFSKWFVKNYGTRRMPNERDFINFVRYQIRYATKDWFYDFAMFFKEYYDMINEGHGRSKNYVNDGDSWWDRFLYWFKDRSMSNGGDDDDETWWDRFLYWFKDRSANNDGDSWWDRFFYWFKDRSINHDWWNHFKLWFKYNLYNKESIYNQTTGGEKEVIDFIEFLKNKFQEKKSNSIGESKSEEKSNLSASSSSSNQNNETEKMMEDTDKEKEVKKDKLYHVAKYVGIGTGLAVVGYFALKGLKVL